MPKQLNKLNEEMVFNGDLAHVVDAMKGIAAAQFYVMERKKTLIDVYGQAVDELFELYDFRRSKHPFVRNANQKKLMVCITTDGGFLGGLNVKVLQMAMKYADSETHYFVIGEKGANYLKEMGCEHTAYPGINIDDSRYDLVESVAGDIMTKTIKEGFGQVVLVYPRSLSFLAQRVETLNIIPCPMFFKGRDQAPPPEDYQRSKIILESASDGIVEYLTGVWLRKRLIEIYEQAKLSEFGARTMHLESAYQTLTKLLKQLKMEFFKARRAKIDQSIRESFTSQLLCED